VTFIVDVLFQDGFYYGRTADDKCGLIPSNYLQSLPGSYLILLICWFNVQNGRPNYKSSFCVCFDWDSISQLLYLCLPPI